MDPKFYAGNGNTIDAAVPYISKKVSFFLL